MRLIPTRRRRQAPPPVTAAVTDDNGTRLGSIRWHDTALRSRPDFAPQVWQNEIHGYVNDGPGIAGWLVEQSAKLLASAPIEVEEYDLVSGKWVDSDYGPARRIVGRIRTKDGDASTLVEQLGKDLEAVAETHLWLDDDPRHGWIYGAATSNQVERMSRGGDERLIIRSRRDAQIGDREYRSVPLNQVVTLIWGASDWPDEPGNQMRRSLPDLRSYAKSTQAVERALDSRLVMNGIVGMQFEAGTPQSAANEVIAAWEAWAKQGITRRDSIAAIAPFVAVGPKVTKVDTGHDVAVANIEAASMLLRQWARSFDWPTDWIVNGPGQAKFANEALVREDVLKGSAGPRARRISGFLTETILRPWARILSSFDRDPELFRVKIAVEALATPEDKTADIIAMADRLGVRREILAEQVGLSAADLIPLPPGVSEMDLWAATLSSASAPAATSPTGRGPGAGNQVALPIRASLDDEIVDAQLVPLDGEIDGWHADDDLLV